MVKRAIKGALDKFGLKLVRTQHTFGLDCLSDIARLYPERKIATVVDVGANVGNFARGVIAAFPSARVHAFEPVDGTFRQLQENLRELPQITPYQMALGEAEGEATLHVQENSEWNSLTPGVNRPAADARAQVVRVRRLDDMAAEGLFGSIDLLKTDTEGYDVQVLRGATGLLGSGRIRFVLSEVGLDRKDTRHTNFFDLNDLLSQHGFTPLGFYDQCLAAYTDRMMFCNALFYFEG
jgi:FkbM family methyltransferase